MEFDRTVFTFFALFLVVYFLESIGGFYMTSAIVSIEKQFQIPSKISGLMISASDFGYIPSVVFVSYLGGKGNRAKWIGGGCVLIAIANIIISASNFFFTAEKISLNNSILSTSIERDVSRFNNSKETFNKFLISLNSDALTEVQKKLINKNNKTVTPQLTSLVQTYHKDWFEKFEYCKDPKKYDNICKFFYTFLSQHNSAAQNDIDKMRQLSATSFALCDASLNKLRFIIETIRCKGNLSYFGPTATIFLGLLILGVGRTMPFSLGLPLIDDNVKKQNLPVCFAGMFFIRIMGPVLGFMMGSFFNKFYYTSNPPQGITPKDPMWIGMWWGGFLVIGILLFGPSLRLFFFRAPPELENDSNSVEDEENDENNKNLQKASKEKNKISINKNEDTDKPLLNFQSIQPDLKNKELSYLDNSKPVRKKQRTKLALIDRHAERNSFGDTVMPTSINEKFSDFFLTISSIIRQPIYSCSLAGRIIDVIAFKGFYIFLPKYLEIQFGIEQYKINLYMGVIGIVGFAIGVLAGSVAMRVYKLDGRRIAVWVAVSSALSAGLSFMNANVGCQSTLTALGETMPNNFNINSTCLSDCGCENALLYPVCDQTGQVYYSPCHAGCKLNSFNTFPEKKKAPVFLQCNCVKDKNFADVSRDFCLNSDCNFQAILYFANMALSGIVGGMGVIPGVLIMLRSVSPKHRSVSLGFNGFLVSLLATLPSPIMWGTIIDYFCIHWEKKCDSHGSCSLYATDKLRVWIHCIYGCLRLISLITDVTVIYYAKDLKIGDAFTENEDKKCIKNSLNKNNNKNQKTSNNLIKEAKFKKSNEETISLTNY